MEIIRIACFIFLFQIVLWLKVYEYPSMCTYLSLLCLPASDMINDNFTFIMP